MAQNSMNLRGAIDLGAVAAAKEAQVLAQKVQATREANPVAAKLILDVTTDTFEELVIKQSALVPVVIDLWATWCEPCKQLSPVLEQLALEYNGKFVRLFKFNQSQLFSFQLVVKLLRYFKALNPYLKLNK